jgi:outer membrane protein assembly factor BamA
MRRLIVSGLLSCLALPGQQNRADIFEAARAQKEQSLQEPEQPKLERLFVRSRENTIYRLLTSEEGFGITFGQMVPSAGFSVGPRYQKSLLDGHVRVGGVLEGSTKQFYIGRFTTSVIALNGRATLGFSAAHSDYPQMPYYGPGPDSRKTGRSNFRIENTGLEVRPAFSPIKRLRFGAIGGFMAINVGPGTDSRYISTDRQFGPSAAPGIQKQTNYMQGGGFVEYDWRDKLGDPTSGGRYYAEYSKLSDRDVGAYSFYRVSLDARQYIPFFHGKRVIALRGATWLTDTRGNQLVPFYMQPTLGGAETMRGFRPNRFYDNNGVLIQGEYRWEASTVMDLALFADGGKVFHNWEQWNLHRIEGSFGFGVRIKSMSGVPLRIDTGFSREGFQVWVRAGNPF